MRENRLTTFPHVLVDSAGRLPFERAKAQLERHTRYWPMIISQTTIFNMQAVSRVLLLLQNAFVSLRLISLVSDNMT